MSEPEPLDFLEYMSMCVSDGLAPLASVQGYAKLLLDDQGSLGSLTEKQREYIGIIYNNSIRAKDHWCDCLGYLQLYYGKTNEKWTGRNLSEVIQLALSDLENYNIGKVETGFSDTLPLVRYNKWLTRAITNLIFPKNYYQVKPKRIKINATLVEQDIRLSILTDVGLSEDQQKKPDEIFLQGIRLLIARLILENLYGSVLVVQASDIGLRFEFNLPIWQLHADAPLEFHLTEANDGDAVELFLGQSLIITLPHKRKGWVDTQAIECNSQILRIGAQESDNTNWRIEFWAFKIGQTSLKVRYCPDGRSDIKTFSVQVVVRA